MTHYYYSSDGSVRSYDTTYTISNETVGKGGGVYDTWALIDIILNSKTPIYTYCAGYAIKRRQTLSSCACQGKNLGGSNPGMSFEERVRHFYNLEQ